MHEDLVSRLEREREQVARIVDEEACVTLQERENVSRFMYPERREASLTKADLIIAHLVGVLGESTTA